MGVGGSGRPAGRQRTGTGTERPRPGRRGAGFSTLEVAVALLILAMVGLALITTVGGAWTGLLGQVHRQQAVGCAARVLEAVRTGLAQGQLPPAEGACNGDGAGLWYQVDLQPDGTGGGEGGSAPGSGGAGEAGGAGPQGGGEDGGAGDAWPASGPVWVRVVVYRDRGPAQPPASPLYTVSTVVWPLRP